MAFFDWFVKSSWSLTSSVSAGPAGVGRGGNLQFPAIGGCRIPNERCFCLSI